MSEGHLYRLPRVDAVGVRALAAQVVGAPCWAFGAAAAWDFIPSRGRDNLRPITPLADAAAFGALDLSGDFGHIFGEAAELRWRRLDEQGYDVLVLSEAALVITGAAELHSEWVDEAGAQRREPWRVDDPGKPRVLREGEGEGDGPLSYRTYHAPNGSVLFLRYTGVRS